MSAFFKKVFETFKLVFIFLKPGKHFKGTSRMFIPRSKIWKLKEDNVKSVFSSYINKYRVKSKYRVSSQKAVSVQGIVML